MNKKIELLNKFGSEIVYIGRRGSYCYGTNSEKSDEDFLVVLKDSYKISSNLQEDVVFISETLFYELLFKMELHIVEAFFNEIYSTVDFEYLRTFIKQNCLKFSLLLKFSYFKATKNQIKQFEKTGDKKFFAKTLLFGGLANADFNLFELLSNNNLKELNSFLYSQYFETRYSDSPMAGDIFQFNQFKQIRFNKLFSSQYKSRFSNYFSSVKKLSQQHSLLNNSSLIENLQNSLQLIF